MFSADIDYLGHCHQLQILLLCIEYRVSLHTFPLPVVFLVSLASLASGTIDRLISATSTEVLLTLSWINVCIAIYFIFMALHLLLQKQCRFIEGNLEQMDNKITEKKPPITPHRSNIFLPYLCASSILFA